MAETYLTPTFQNAVKPQAPPTTGANPPAPGGAPAPLPAQTGGEQYQTPAFQNAVKPPAPAQTGGQQQTTGGAAQPSDWSVKGWGPGLLPQPGFGDVKLPQSVQDWATIANNEQMVGGLPGLRTQAEAARQRIGPVAAGSADVVGNILSPTSLLTAVPGVGPELAGGVHEGVKSAIANWTPAESWGTYLKNVGEDTAGGAAAGLAGQGTAYAAEKALPELIKGGVVTGAGYLGHKMLGGYASGDVMKEVPGLFGLYKMIDKGADWAGEQGKALVSSPEVQQAIKSLVLGAGSAARQATGPYNQWIIGGQ
jgi:hypothetical protein